MLLIYWKAGLVAFAAAEFLSGNRCGSILMAIICAFRVKRGSAMLMPEGWFIQRILPQLQRRKKIPKGQGSRNKRKGV
jgi:hypothetical protein